MLQQKCQNEVPVFPFQKYTLNGTHLNIKPNKSSNETQSDLLHAKSRSIQANKSRSIKISLNEFWRNLLSTNKMNFIIIKYSGIFYLIN